MERSLQDADKVMQYLPYRNKQEYHSKNRSKEFILPPIPV